MFGISFIELIIFLSIALIVLGPDKTIKSAIYLGKSFKKITSLLNEYKKELSLSQTSSEITTNLNDFTKVVSSNICDTTKSVNGFVSKEGSSWKKNSLPKASHLVSQKDLQRRITELEKQIAILKKPKRIKNSKIIRR